MGNLIPKKVFFVQLKMCFKFEYVLNKQLNKHINFNRTDILESHKLPKNK